MSATKERKRRILDLDLALPVKRSFKATLQGDTESEEEGFKIICQTPPQHNKRIKTSSVQRSAQPDGGENMTPDK